MLRFFGLDPRIPGGGVMSQREFARRTGVPRSTIQDFLRDPSRSRAGTLSRITKAAASTPAVKQSTGIQTERFDAVRWEPETLRGIVAPEGAVAQRIVYESSTYGSGFASTTWDADMGLDAEELASVWGVAPESVVRVLYDVPR